jgi:ubiquinone/menaquinone biosynthesis C-methylase UbiE
LTQVVLIKVRAKRLMDRKQVEKEFHDKLRAVGTDEYVAETRWSPELEETIKKNPLWVNMKYYAIERASRNFVERWYEQHVEGMRVLDYCCGNGEDGVLIVGFGAKEVVGIDISEVSVENSQNLAVREGFADRVSHMVADAEETGFEDSTFDIVTEYGSLHHLDLDKAFAELARVLKPGGKAICQEAIRHNPLIHLYRKLTPSLRTPWEIPHILGRSSLNNAKRYFETVEVHHYHLVSLLSVPFRHTKLFNPLLSLLERVDQVLLSIPGLRWMAWQMVIVLSDPKK